MSPVSPILNREDTDVAFIHDAVTIRTMTQIRNRDDSISSLIVCWDANLSDDEKEECQELVDRIKKLPVHKKLHELSDGACKQVDFLYTQLAKGLKLNEDVS